MYSKSLLFFVIFLTIQVCCQTDIVEFSDIVQQVELVTPSSDAFEDFFISADNIMNQYELDELFQSRTLQYEFFDQIEELLKSNESTYPFVLYIPNSAMLPFVKSQADAGAKRGLQEIKDVDDAVDITHYELNVSVPTTGICKNTYRADLKIQAGRELCADIPFLGEQCTTPILTISGHSCVNIEADNWLLNLNIVDVDAKFDGSDIWGKFIALILKVFKIDELMKDKIQESFDSVDLGKMVDEEIIGKAFVIIDDLAPAIQEAQNTTDKEFQQYIDKVKETYSQKFKQLINIAAEIQTENLVFTARF